MLKLTRNRIEYISRDGNKICINPNATQEQYDRFVSHMNRVYGSNWTYLNVITELNHFKW